MYSGAEQHEGANVLQENDGLLQDLCSRFNGTPRCPVV